jgi:hypothetical protein
MELIQWSRDAGAPGVGCLRVGCCLTFPGFVGVVGCKVQHMLWWPMQVLYVTRFGLRGTEPSVL